MEGDVVVADPVVLGVVVVALAFFAAFGAWRSRGRIDTLEDFVVARNAVGDWTLVATLVASSMGAWILFSPAEAGAAFGGVTAVLGYGLGSAIPLVAFAVIGPRLRRLMPEGYGLTEFAHVRYGRPMYAYVLLVTVAYMFVFLAAEFTGIAGALSLLADVPPWQTATLVGVTALGYTAYGGLRASMSTDLIQAAMVVPLLGVTAVAATLALGGPREAYATVATAEPQLVSLSYRPGLEFGVYIVVAVLGAELLNQAWWQRLYAARDDRTLRRSFLVAALVVAPMVTLAGLFGLAAAGYGLVEGNPSIAFFLVVESALSDVVAGVVALLAVLLVVSSADTLFNAIASAVSADLPRALAARDDGLGVARGVTVVVALAAIVVGAQGYDVLELFLLADLLAAATFVPLLYGLYSPRAWGGGAIAASLVGLVVGLAFFPPAHGVFALPFAPSFLYAFLGAAFLSALGAVVTARVGGRTYDLSRLGEHRRREE